MSKELYIIPGDGMTIPNNTDSQPIGEDGDFVPNNRFYRNFLKRKEAKAGKPPKPEKQTPSTSKTADKE